MPVQNYLNFLDNLKKIYKLKQPDGANVIHQNLQDLMFNATSEISDDPFKELHLIIKNNKYLFLSFKIDFYIC